MTKIGLLTIGQSPRTDFTEDIKDILGDKAEITESGALDGLCREEIEKLSPGETSSVLVSRLKDGGFARLDEEKLLPLLEKRINELEERGVGLIVLLCTGKFPELKSKVPLIYPQRLLHRLVPIFCGHECIAVVNPDEKQCEQSAEKWGEDFKTTDTFFCNPYSYKGVDDIINISEELKRSPSANIILDCMGYTRKMKEDFERLTGKNVILPRILVAEVVSELIW